MGDFLTSASGPSCFLCPKACLKPFKMAGDIYSKVKNEHEHATLVMHMYAVPSRQAFENLDQFFILVRGMSPQCPWMNIKGSNRNTKCEEVGTTQSKRDLKQHKGFISNSSKECSCSDVIDLILEATFDS